MLAFVSETTEDGGTCQQRGKPNVSLGAPKQKDDDVFICILYEYDLSIYITNILWLSVYLFVGPKSSL